MQRATQQGVTLVELMITVAVIGIVAAVAMPMYNEYLENTRIGVMQDNIQTIRLMQEERRRDRGEYTSGSYFPSGAKTLSTNLGWAPESSVNEISYVVTCDTPGTAPECERLSGYEVVATHSNATASPITINLRLVNLIATSSNQPG